MKKTTRKKTIKSHKPNERLIIEKLPGYFLLLCLTTAIFFLFYMLWPFITSIFLAAILAILFYPMHKRIAKAFGNWQRLAAFLSCLIVVLIIVIPIAVFVILLGSEAVSTYGTVQEQIDSGVFDEYLVWADGFYSDIQHQIEPFVDLEELGLKETLLDLAQKTTTWLARQVTVILEGFFTFFFDFLMMFISMFYFFKDGKAIVKRIGEASPLPKKHESELFSKIVVMVKAIMFGVFFAALFQGLLGGIGFAIAGISNAVFWGTAIGFFSIVPIVGTAVVFVPAVIVLLISGNYFAAIFIFFWGMLVVGTSDNVLRTIFIGNKAKTYPLLTFFIIIGGIIVFGLKGVIIGPLLLMILMSLLHIYEIEYKKVLKS